MFSRMKTKQALRVFAREQRRTLSERQREEMSVRIADLYMQCFELERPNVLHLFLPIPNLLEVNTMHILEPLNKRYPNVKTVSSVIAEDQKTLLTVEVRYDSVFVTNNWGIREPVERIFCNELEIEEVLTPLLAIDKRGYRIGYGKGFYDRFFEKCSNEVKKTGLNYFAPLEELVPNDAWDVALSRLVDPENVTDFI
jgi:5-formyltetrahydrofolate cyclo-ligase